MIKRILLSILVVMPLLGKNSPQDVEFMAKLNKLEAIRKEIAEKETRIDELNKSGSNLIYSLTYGYEHEQLDLICKEANKLQLYIVHALNNNIDVANAIYEPLCSAFTIHRNELDRVQHMLVRIAAEYFFLQKLYRQYNDALLEITQTQFTTTDK